MRDLSIVKAVAFGILAVTIIGMVGIVALTLTDHQAPDSFITLTGTALGGLTGFLISTRGGDEKPPTP